MEFKDIPGYEGKYQISRCGKVKSLNYRGNGYEKILKSTKYSCGYIYVELGKGNKYRVHRLVGKVYIINPKNKPYINHINGIKTDNRVENLEWATAKENTQHAYDNGLHRGRNGNINNGELLVSPLKK